MKSEYLFHNKFDFRVHVKPRYSWYFMRSFMFVWSEYLIGQSVVFQGAGGLLSSVFYSLMRLFSCYCEVFLSNSL